MEFFINSHFTTGLKQNQTWIIAQEITEEESLHTKIYRQVTVLIRS